MVDDTKKRNRILVTLNDYSDEILEFMKRTRDMKTSVAIDTALSEWYETHAKSAASAPLKHREMTVDMDSGATTVPKPLLSDVRPHEDIEVVPEYQ